MTASNSNLVKTLSLYINRYKMRKIIDDLKIKFWNIRGKENQEDVKILIRKTRYYDKFTRFYLWQCLISYLFSITQPLFSSDFIDFYRFPHNHETILWC